HRVTKTLELDDVWLRGTPVDGCDGEQHTRTRQPERDEPEPWSSAFERGKARKHRNRSEPRRLPHGSAERTADERNKEIPDRRSKLGLPARVHERKRAQKASGERGEVRHERRCEGNHQWRQTERQRSEAGRQRAHAGKSEKRAKQERCPDGNRQRRDTYRDQ